MTFQRLAPAALGLMALVAVTSPGCSCGGDSTSPAYRIQGGVIGANGSLP